MLQCPTMATAWLAFQAQYYSEGGVVVHFDSEKILQTLEKANKDIVAMNNNYFTKILGPKLSGDENEE